MIISKTNKDVLEPLSYTDRGEVRVSMNAYPKKTFTYDGSNVTQINYYDGEREIIQISSVPITSSINSKYFTLDGYYVWFNTDGYGDDPTIDGKTGIELTLPVGTTASVLADAFVIALNDISGDYICYKVEPNAVFVEANNFGTKEEPVDYDSGCTVKVINQGAAFSLAKTEDFTWVDGYCTEIITKNYRR